MATYGHAHEGLLGLADILVLGHCGLRGEEGEARIGATMGDGRWGVEVAVQVQEQVKVRKL